MLKLILIAALLPISAMTQSPTPDEPLFKRADGKFVPLPKNTYTVPGSDSVCIPAKPNEIIVVRRFLTLKSAVSDSRAGDEIYLTNGVYKQ